MEGYAHGIANTYKFETRINRHIDELREGKHIYDLTTYETGKGLALRNIAEDYFYRKDYINAKIYFMDFFKTGMESGNKLCAIKGLLVLAKCNHALSVIPLLEPNDLRTLKDLIRSIEGKNWQSYLSIVLKEIEQ